MPPGVLPPPSASEPAQVEPLPPGPDLQPAKPDAAAVDLDGAEKADDAPERPPAVRP